MYRSDKDGSIKLTRGDYVPLVVTPVLHEEKYTLKTYDYLIFTLKSSPYDAVPLVQIRTPKGTNTFEILGAHTKNLNFGTYRYDVELVFGEDGEHYTLINNKRFKVVEEVGWNE